MSWVERINIVKMLFYQKQSTELMKCLSNYQWHFSQNRTKSFTICMEAQKDPSSQSSSEKEEWSWRNQLT